MLTFFCMKNIFQIITFVIITLAVSNTNDYDKKMGGRSRIYVYRPTYFFQINPNKCKISLY